MPAVLTLAGVPPMYPLGTGSPPPAPTTSAPLYKQVLSFIALNHLAILGGCAVTLAGVGLVVHKHRTPTLISAGVLGVATAGLWGLERSLSFRI